MTHRSKSRKPRHRFLRGSLLLVFLIVLVDLITLVMNRVEGQVHGGAPTFTVCHAVQRQDKGERYFCSNDGCYSSEREEMTVVGSYDDGNTCAGIAEKLGQS